MFLAMEIGGNPLNIIMEMRELFYSVFLKKKFFVYVYILAFLFYFKSLLVLCTLIFLVIVVFKNYKYEKLV